MGDRVARLSAVDCVKSPFFVLLESASKKVTCTCMLCEINGEEDAVERDQVKRDGRVMCFKYPQECRSPGFGEQDLAAHLPPLRLQDVFGGAVLAHRDPDEDSARGRNEGAIGG